MRCNACWRELEGRAVSTTCGHILCTEDASKILNNDGACPMCDQVLSKNVVKPVDINPNDEWTNVSKYFFPRLQINGHRVTIMAMTGVSPQTLMKSAYRSVMFYIGQKELELQYKMNRVVAQYRQKFEAMQEKFTEKMEQVHTAYQKMAKKCQTLEQEVESLSKDKQELQEKFAEKSRQKRKLEEMYDQLRNEYELSKRSAIQPANTFFSRNENDLFFNPAAVVMDGRDPTRKDWSVHAPPTPGSREDIWPTKQNSSGFGQFDIGSGSPTKQGLNPSDHGNKRTNVHSAFGAGPVNPSMTLRNLILSPIKRPQLSRNRPQLFTL